MAKRTWQALVLGQLPEARDVFARPIFKDDLPTESIHVSEPEEFDEALEEHPVPDVILIDVKPHGLEILRKVREIFPVSPLVMVGEAKDADVLIQALEEGLERYVIRIEDHEKFVSLLSLVVYKVLQHTVEPPNMDTPSAEQMHRYAQYHHILHPFFVVGDSGRLLYVNAAGERLVWKLIGRNPVIGEHLYKDLLHTLGEPFKRQLEGALEGHESVVQYSVEEVEAPQERSVHCTPLLTGVGRTIAASVSVHQQIPPEVERTRTMRAISRFAGGLAHDFNNLLNVMMVQTELLRIYLADVTPPVEACIESIVRAVGDGSELTRQLLAISHETLAYRTAIRLNDLLEALEPELRKMLRDSQTFEMELADVLPPVQADPQQIEQLVCNLIENGADALGRDGTISVRTEVVGPNQTDPMPRGLESRRWVVLKIKDTGPGVRPSLHSRIFEPFFTTRRAEGHSGLGLTLVHAVVEQVGGRIFIDSEQGDGCLFTIFLPAGDESQVPAESRQPSEAPAAQPKRFKVLMVEDEDDLRMPFREALIQHGFEVVEAQDVSTGLNQVEKHGPEVDVVISDVVMPGGSGVEVVQALVEVNPEVEVVFVSGYTAEVVEEAEGELDFDYLFLAKPVTLSRLIEVVDDLLEDRRGQGSSDGPDKADATDES